MYFPVAGIEVSPWLPPLVAFSISFFTSMGGVSGAFLLLPFQVSVLGFTSPSVSATNQVFNIVAIPSGVYRYIREGRMVWPLTWVVIIGTLPGVLIGAVLRISYLPNPKNFKLFAGLVLLYIGGRLLRDLLKKKQDQGGKASAEEQFQKVVKEYHQRNIARSESGKEELPRVAVKKFSMTRIVYEFYGQTFDVNTMGIMALSFIVGIIGGVYGIGGGAIIAPFFVSFFGLPVYTVAGAALMGTFVTSVAGVAFYQIIAPFHPGMAIAPDWLLGFLFGTGGFAGMYCGARMQKFVPARVIKWILTFCILVPALRYIWGFFR
ncbi:MAG: sulfite exporter TauE/SafE family protein [Proteobacteria bacterium]|nr:sulfite exporter TauE/SafE family protein [Pseudomonadota bacterium]MBU0965784.1 sulfite exporter TauE/SafE family protein [Pseudomonadota bacterium]